MYSQAIFILFSLAICRSQEMFPEQSVKVEETVSSLDLPNIKIIVSKS